MQKIRKKFKVLLCLCSCLMICGFLTSCGKKGDLSASWEEDGLDTQVNGQLAEESGQDSEELAQSPETAEGEDDVRALAGEGIAGALQSETEDGPMIYVQILGAVKEPGVYKVPEGSRLFQIVELAGGFTKGACQESVNQASVVTDEQQIYVYTQKEAEELRESGTVGFIGNLDISEGVGSESPSGDGRVNINTAGKEQLMSLPGIGESKAESIVQYRENAGKFSSIEDIMKVDGIKEGVYNKIKEQITI